MSGTPYLAGTFHAASGGSTTPSVSLTTSVAQGDTVIVGVLCTSGSVTSVADTQLNGYLLIQSETTTAGCQIYTFACYGALPLAAGVDTLTVTYSTNASVQAVIAVGDNNVTQFGGDIAVGATATSGTTASVATGVLSNAEEHIIAFAADLSAGGSPTVSAPLTSLTPAIQGGTTAFLVAGFNDVTVTTSTTPTATWTTSTTWAISVVSNPVAGLAVGIQLSDGVLSEAYSQTLTASGGIGPYTWSISSGSLPTGLSLASGVISGTPTVAGQYTFTVKVTDANSSTATAVQVVTVVARGFNGATWTLPAQGTPLANNYFTIAATWVNFITVGDTFTDTRNPNQVFTVTSIGAPFSGFINVFFSPNDVTAMNSPDQVTQIAPALTMPSNMLTAADSDFEVGGFTWAAETNANAPAISNLTSLTGIKSLSWSTPAAGLSQIHTGFYPVQPSMPYIASIFSLIPNAYDVFLGIEWYTSGNVLIATTFGDDNPATPSQGGMVWQSNTVRGTSPQNATQMKLTLQVGSSNAGDVFHVDLAYLNQTNCQVLVDWINPPFGGLGLGGQDFIDCSMFVRMDQGITITRGRQDAISEIQPSSFSMQLQNDTGIYTKFNNDALVNVVGGQVTLGRRIQINLADQVGVWYTRFDGMVSETDYAFDNTGSTSVMTMTGTDVLTHLNRQDPLSCWTKEQVIQDSPAMMWALDDPGNTGGSGPAAQTAAVGSASEQSGGNGPPARLVSSDSSKTATVQWQSASGGVETLADAVAAFQPDGSEFWPAGSNRPNYQLRGLDSGAAGPFTTPLPNVYFVPKLTAAANFDYFVSNRGYQLQVNLSPSQYLTTSNGFTSYSLECWFTWDPHVAGLNNTHDGPYINVSLGDTRTGNCVVAGLFQAGAVIRYEVNSYNQPPGFIGSNYAGLAPPTATNVVEITPTVDTTQLPHHLVITIVGSSTGGVVAAYLDGNILTTNGLSTGVPDFVLPIGTVYNQITIGGAFGGSGCHYGAMSMVSLYNYQLTPTQVVQHCQMGQYGMWETPTDDCIQKIADFAGIPPYWNNLIDAHNGLSLTEYFNIAGSNPLAAMQAYEQAEMGLLYVNAAGQLTFHTRDWRQGYGAPDLILPPNSFDAQLGYEQIDQFLENEYAASGPATSGASLPTSTDQGANGTMMASFVNLFSQSEYGVYSQHPRSSPVALPLISWSRGFGQLGISSYYYWADPYLQDVANWHALAHSEPYLTPATLKVDLLTLDPTTGLTIAEFYALDIDNMVAPVGPLPASFPSASLSMEWFIEGVTENISTTTRSLQFFCSPAEVQRAWRPGDTTYGVLGTTARIGVSSTDLSVPQADGKDVSHDGGRPYWPPTISAQSYSSRVTQDSPAAWWQLNDGAGTTAADSSGNGHTGTATSVTFGSTGPQAGVNSGQFNGSTSTITTSYNPSSSTGFTVEAWINAIGAAESGNPRIVSNSHTDFSSDKKGFELWINNLGAPNVSFGTGSTVITASGNTPVPANGWAYLAATWDGLTVNLYLNGELVDSTSLVGNLAAGNSNIGIGFDPTYSGDFFNGDIAQVAVYLTALTGQTIQQHFAAMAPALNNPAANGHEFVGANEMRGLADNLNLLLNPPMMVASTVSQSQTMPNGSNASPQVFFDTINLDTVGGMGAIAGWPNWYVCLVPGFYEIDANLNWGKTSFGTSINPAQGFICVAQQAAQALAAGNGTPLTVAQYVCPIGEQQVIVSNNTIDTICNPATRLYLGLGDMVALCAEQPTGGNFSLGTTNGGSHLSIRFVGYGTTDDRCELNTLITGGTVTIQPSTKAKHVKTYNSVASYSYYGATALPIAFTMRNRNGQNFQGFASWAQLPVTGFQIGTWLLPFAQMQTDMGSTAQILSVQMTMRNIGSFYKSGATALIGWSSRTSAGTYWAPSSADHFAITAEAFGRFQTKTFFLPAKSFAALATGTGFMLLGFTKAPYPIPGGGQVFKGGIGGGGSGPPPPSPNEKFYGTWAPQITLVITYLK